MWRIKVCWILMLKMYWKLQFNNLLFIHYILEAIKSTFLDAAFQFWNRRIIQLLLKRIDNTQGMNLLNTIEFKLKNVNSFLSLETSTHAASTSFFSPDNALKSDLVNLAPAWMTLINLFFTMCHWKCCWTTSIFCCDNFISTELDTFSKSNSSSVNDKPV